MDSDTEGNKGERQEQAPDFQPLSHLFTFRSQGSPKRSPFTPPSQLFTFEVGTAYLRPVLSSGFSPIDDPPQPLPPYAGYEADLERLSHLEKEVEELKKRDSDLQRQVNLLTEQDEQERGRSSRLLAPQPPPPPPPPPPPLPFLPLPPSPPSPSPSSTVDQKAELHHLQREDNHKKAVAEKAHNDAKCVEAEVRREAQRDKFEHKRRDWWDKNKERAASPPHPFPIISPAISAQSLTPFTTTLAFRPASAVSQDPSRLAVAPILPKPPPTTTAATASRIPIPSRGRSRSQSRSTSGEREVTERLVRLAFRPAPKGILRKADDQNGSIQKGLKFVRFHEIIRVAQIVEYQEDGGDDDDDDGYTSGVDDRMPNEPCRR